VIERLQSLKDEWDRELERLVAQYPELRVKQLAQLEAQAETFVREEMKKVPSGEAIIKARQEELIVWLAAQKKANESFYPAVDKLREKFSFNWRMFRISALDGIEDLDTVEVQRAQNQLRDELQSWVRAAAGTMHQALGEAAQNAKNMLEKNGKLTPRNLTPLFNAFESFLSVDFTGKSTFRSTIDTIKRQFLIQNPDGTYNLSQMSENIGVEAHRQAFTQLLGTMSELAVQDSAEAAGIETLSVSDFGRMIDLG
jgi:hypothetical protein